MDNSRALMSSVMLPSLVSGVWTLFLMCCCGSVSIMASVYSDIANCESAGFDYLHTFEAIWRFGNLSEEQQYIINGLDDTHCGQMCLVSNMLLPGSVSGK